MLAEMLWNVAVALYNYWLGVGQPNVVILGRDAWPLVPLMRKLGVPCQYFLFSRLQIGDKGTEEQWLKEVPKESLVVDTGYKGSIFDAIFSFDPSIRGVLVCSKGNYPQMRLNYSHAEVVREIEKMPKLVGRCVNIDCHGYARCPQDTRDEDENLEGLTPVQVAEYNRQLLEQLNVDPSWATFTGQTPEDRVQKIEYSGACAWPQIKIKLHEEPEYVVYLDDVLIVQEHVDCGAQWNGPGFQKGYAAAVNIPCYCICEDMYVFADTNILSESLEFSDGIWKNLG